VVRALKKSGADPTYLEFFGFTRPPFARLSQPAEIFHTEQYSILMAHLASATEQPDCLVVVCGADGSGKTTLLNRYITSLGEDISFATIDETCEGEKDFYSAFLRQLGFSDITGTAGELRRITKEFLINRGMAGDPVLMMIDNAQLVNPTVLEQLQRIAAIKVKNRRAISVVLAGNSDLVRVMESPAMSQTKFQSHVQFAIRVYTEEETANYVWHHLRLAGGSDAVKFSKEAHALIYRYTGGTPSLINMLCNALLTEAHTRETKVITEELVRTVADNRKLLPHVVPLQGKGRRKTDPDFKLVQPERQAEERITPRESTAKEPGKKSTSKAEKEDGDGKNLLDHISQLSEQFGELRAERMRALEDIGTRDKDISELREQLDLQTEEFEKLAKTLGENTEEIARLNKEVADGAKALAKSDTASKKLTADLKKEKAAVKKAKADTEKAEADIEKAEATAKEMGQLNSELQAAVKDLTTDLKMAGERVGEIDKLEKNVASLKDDIKKRDSELTTLQGALDAGNEAIGDLEERLKESQDECGALQTQVAAMEDLEESLMQKDARIAELKGELASFSEAIMSLQVGSEKFDTREDDVERDEGVSILKSNLKQVESKSSPEAELPEIELPEIELTLTGNTPGLIEGSKSIPPSESETLNVPMPEKKVAASEKAASPDETAEVPGVSTTAFEVVKDGKVEQVVEVPPGQSRVMIGRSENSELRLISEFVSRHHALISCTEKGLYIEDLNSFNGTLVNSKAITRCDLLPDDVVMIGDFEIRTKLGTAATRRS
jgi:general secretion pathway protein A